MKTYNLKQPVEAVQWTGDNFEECRALLEGVSFAGQGKPLGISEVNLGMIKIDLPWAGGVHYSKNMYFVKANGFTYAQGEKEFEAMFTEQVEPEHDIGVSRYKFEGDIEPPKTVVNFFGDKSSDEEWQELVTKHLPDAYEQDKYESGFAELKATDNIDLTARAHKALADNCTGNGIDVWDISKQLSGEIDKFESVFAEFCRKDIDVYFQPERPTNVNTEDIWGDTSKSPIVGYRFYGGYSVKLDDSDEIWQSLLQIWNEHQLDPLQSAKDVTEGKRQPLQLECREQPVWMDKTVLDEEETDDVMSAIKSMCR